MLRPRWKLTLVERPSVSSQSVRVSREGLGLLETPKTGQDPGHEAAQEEPIQTPGSWAGQGFCQASVPTCRSLSLLLPEDAVTEEQEEDEEEDGQVQQGLQHADHSECGNGTWSSCKPHRASC